MKLILKKENELMLKIMENKKNHFILNKISILSFFINFVVEIKK